jgi:hypothetical protein
MEVDAPISFTTTNFTGMPAGTCGGVSKTCGHVHLYVDQTAAGTSPCTPMGASYNNASPLAVADAGPTPFSPINAIMSECANTDPTDGSHTVLLELHADDHTPIVNASGATISATVQFTASGP